jgi:hypothetical protein
MPIIDFEPDAIPAEVNDFEPDAPKPSEREIAFERDSIIEPEPPGSDWLGVGEEVRGMGDSLARGTLNFFQSKNQNALRRFRDIPKEIETENSLIKEAEDYLSGKTPHPQVSIKGFVTGGEEAEYRQQMRNRLGNSARKVMQLQQDHERIKAALPNILKEYQGNQEVIEQIPLTEAQAEFQKPETPWWKFFSNPVELAALTSAESAPVMAQSLVASPLGPGAVALATGVGSYNAEQSARVMNAMVSANVDIKSPEEVMAWFADRAKSDPELAKADLAAMGPATFDALTAGIAGRWLHSATGGGAKKIAGAMAKESGVQMAGGGLGSIAGNKLAGENIDWKDVVLEMAGEIAPTEAIQNVAAENGITIGHLSDNRNFERASTRAAQEAALLGTLPDMQRGQQFDTTSVSVTLERLNHENNLAKQGSVLHGSDSTLNWRAANRVADQSFEPDPSDPPLKPILTGEEESPESQAADVSQSNVSNPAAASATPPAAGASPKTEVAGELERMIAATESKPLSPVQEKLANLAAQVADLQKTLEVSAIPEPNSQPPNPVNGTLAAESRQEDVRTAASLRPVSGQSPANVKQSRTEGVTETLLNQGDTIQSRTESNQLPSSSVQGAGTTAGQMNPPMQAIREQEKNEAAKEARKGQNQAGYQGMTEAEVAAAQRGEKTEVAKSQVLQDFSRSEPDPKETASVESDQAELDRIGRNTKRAELKGLVAIGRGDARVNSILRSGLPNSIRRLSEVVSKSGRATIAELERLFGVRFIFVETDGFNGVKIVGSNVIVLNVNSRRAMLAVAGHELLHHIRLVHPGLYSEFFDNAYGLLKNSAKFRAWLEANGYGEMTEAGVSEELFGNILGDALLDENFLNLLAKQEPNLFKRFARRALEWIKGLIAKAKAKPGFGSSEFVTDLEAMRDHLAGLLRESARQTQFGKAGIKEEVDSDSGAGLYSLRETANDIPGRQQTSTADRRGNVGGREPLRPAQEQSGFEQDAARALREASDRAKSFSDLELTKAIRASELEVVNTTHERGNSLHPRPRAIARAELRAYQAEFDARKSSHEAKYQAMLRNPEWLALQQRSDRNPGSLTTDERAKLKVFWQGESQFSKEAFRASNATIEPPALFSIEAHHGTPHKVDKFTTAKIGTGEGAQVYGWGLYFAENRQVSSMYRETLSSGKIEVDGKPADKLTSKEQVAAGMIAETSYAGALQYAEQIRKEYPEDSNSWLHWTRVRDAIKAMEGKTVKLVEGNEYTVSLNVEPDELIDYDKLLKDQHPKVKAALLDSGLVNEYGTSIKFILPDNAASAKQLSDIGIKGIRYLDQGSRGRFIVQKRIDDMPGGKQLESWVVLDRENLYKRSGSFTGDNILARFDSKLEAEANAASRQTYNYVIFSDDDITITHENGKAVTAGALFSKEGGFAFDAPESVAEQKTRQATEKRATGQAEAKTAMQERAGAKLTGSDLDTTGEMKSGQGSLFSKEKAEHWIEENDLKDMAGRPIAINPDGTVSLFHRTSPSNAREIALFSKSGPFDDSATRRAVRSMLRGQPVPKEFRDVQAKYLGVQKYFEEALRLSIVAARKRVYAEFKTKADRDAAMERLGNYWLGQIPLSAVGGPQTQLAAETFRNDLDSLAMTAAANGMVPDSQVKTWIGNTGEWLKRTYLAFDDTSDWNYDQLNKRRAKEPEIQRIWQNAENYLKAQNPKFSAKQIEAEMRSLIDRREVEAALFGRQPGESRSGFAADTGSLIKRKDIPPELLEWMGQIKDPIARAQQSSKWMSQFLARNLMQRELAKVGLDMGWFSEQAEGRNHVELYPNVSKLTPVVDPVTGATVKAPSGNVEAEYRTNIDRRHEPLHGLYTSPEMLAALQQFDGMMNTGIATATRLTNIVPSAVIKGVGLWKMGKVALNPISYAVNIFGAITMRLMAGGANPLHIANALLAVASRNAVIDKASSMRMQRARANYLLATKQGITGKGIFTREIDASFGRESEPQSGRRAIKALADLVSGRGSSGARVRLGRALMDMLKLPGEIGIKFADDVARVSAFLDELKLSRQANPTFTDQQHADWASVRAGNIYQTYDNLPVAIRDASNLGVLSPFISFTAEMFRNAGWIAYYGQQGLRSDNPALRRDGAQKLAGMAAMIALPIVLSALSRGNVDDDDEKAKRKIDALQRWFVPPWDRGEDMMLLKFGKDRVEYVPMSYLLPTAQLSRIPRQIAKIPGNESPTRAINQMVDGLMTDVFDSGVYGTVMETLMNSRGEGRKITRAEGFQGWQDRAAYAWKNFRPGVVQLADEWMMAQAGEKGFGGREYTTEEIGMKLAGLRVRTVSPKQAIPFVMRDFNQRWRDASAVATLQAERTPTNTEAVKEAQDYKSTKQAQIKKDYAQFLKDAELIGFGREEVLNLAGEEKIYLPKELKQ